MAQVNVGISGRSYRIACDDGQEDHLRKLAAQVDASIGDMRETFGEIGDQRLTIMAAITLADRIDEMERRLEALSGERAGLEVARDEAAAREAAGETELVRVVESVAERIETLAVRIGGLEPDEALVR